MTSQNWVDLIQFIQILILWYYLLKNKKLNHD